MTLQLRSNHLPIESIQSVNVSGVLLNFGSAMQARLGSRNGLRISFIFAVDPGLSWPWVITETYKICMINDQAADDKRLVGDEGYCFKGPMEWRLRAIGVWIGIVHAKATGDSLLGWILIDKSKNNDRSLDICMCSVYRAKTWIALTSMDYAVCDVVKQFYTNTGCSWINLC